MATRRALAAVVSAGLTLAVAVAHGVTSDSSGVSVLVADAAFPAAMAALPDGGLIYGERFTGRIVEVAVDWSTTASSAGSSASLSRRTGRSS